MATAGGARQTGEGAAVADEVRKLLDYIVDHYVVHDELRNIDLDATSREPAETIEADKRQAVRRESDRAGDLARAFSRGLTLAYQRRRMGGNELALDDRQPDQDQMADALIRFLVSHDLAESRTEETAPLHYTYYVKVDWPRLSEVARAAGVDLDRALHDRAAEA